MSYFLDFYRKQQSLCLLKSEKSVEKRVAEDALENPELLALLGSGSIRKKSGFKSVVTEIATDESFLSEVSSAVGEPKSGENEDAFVERAKLKMTEVLRKKLNV